MKRLTCSAEAAAYAYAINPHPYGKQPDAREKRLFELGARRMLDYLTQNGYVEKAP